MRPLCVVAEVRDSTSPRPAADNAATTIAAAGSPTNPGTTILLSNGKTATVTFNRDTFGGTLTIDGVTTQLAAGVTALAE